MTNKSDAIDIASEVIVRPCVEADVETIRDIYLNAFGYDRAVLLAFSGFDKYALFCVNKGYSYILEEKGKPCGVVLAYEKPDLLGGVLLYVELLAVLPEYQNKGYGTTLMSKIETEAKRNSIIEITLRTMANMAAYEFYKKRGFVDCNNTLRYMTKFIVDVPA